MWFFFNKTVVELYRSAYLFDTGGFIDWHNHLVELDLRDKERYIRPQWDTYDYWDWVKKNTYCYTSRIQSSSNVNIFAKMKNNLDDFFNIKSRIEYRSVKCLVLKKLATVNKQNRSVALLNSKAEDKVIIKNNSLKMLAQRICSEYKIKPPLIFDPKQKFTIELPWDSGNYSIEELRKKLNQIGLDLVEEYKKLGVLVLGDKN